MRVATVAFFLRQSNKKGGLIKKDGGGAVNFQLLNPSSGDAVIKERS